MVNNVSATQIDLVSFSKDDVVCGVNDDIICGLVCRKGQSLVGAAHYVICFLLE